MNYELAVKLKESGFPQKPAIQFSETLVVQEAAYTPTLSELIEECGEDFVSLVRIGSKWVTNHFEWNEGLDEKWDTEGLSPEEAVANLYLTLNNKD